MSTARCKIFVNGYMSLSMIFAVWGGAYTTTVEVTPSVSLNINFQAFEAKYRTMRDSGPKEDYGVKLSSD